MIEDKTYCIRDCNYLQWKRNKKNVKSHSFVDLEHTRDCKKEGKNETN